MIKLIIIRSIVATCTHTHQVFSLIILLFPPSCKESHLNVDECSALVNHQLLDDSVQDVLHSCMLNAVVSCGCASEIKLTYSDHACAKNLTNYFMCKE